jgi:starch synthase (maltosyl-transferring)
MSSPGRPDSEPSRAPPEGAPRNGEGRDRWPADDGRVRVVIEGVAPAVDGGRFAVKRTLGDTLQVEADCFADGHDVVAAALLWRRPGETRWHAAPMTPLGNDRWRAGFTVDALGDWAYAVRAWVDPWLSWRHDFTRRVDADDLRVAARAGVRLIAEAAERARGPQDPDVAVPDAPHTRAADAATLQAWADELAAALAADAPVEALQRLGGDPARAAVAARHPDLRHARTDAVAYPLSVERERARFSAWYEFFPRSASDDPAATARSPTARPGCPTSPAWASTCSTCRRSTRSDARCARVATTR